MNLERYHRALERSNTVRGNGRVTKIVGLVTEADGPISKLGSICEIHPAGGSAKVKAEVLGFRDSKVVLMPLGDMRGVGPGSRVVTDQHEAVVQVGKGLLGRVIDGLGEPIDGKGPVQAEEELPIYSRPMNPLERMRIRTPLDIGIRAINGLLTIGCGQRIGLFSGSGVGKSVLLGMIAGETSADVKVIALIGERGREVNEFIQGRLGDKGLEGSVIVVATSNQLPLIRMRGAFVATAIAEHFRNQGKHVLFMMDSITRFAMAQREVGLATGEPPTTKGYTPSVFALLPRLLERAGTCSGAGTITGLYTVYVEGDDMNDPVADAVRAVLDGHIVLSRELAARNQYPAIDILNSTSRVMEDIASPEHREMAGRLKSYLARYKSVEDLVNIGAYTQGTNPEIDNAINMYEEICGYLKQDLWEGVNFQSSISQLKALLS